MEMMLTCRFLMNLNTVVNTTRKMMQLILLLLNQVMLLTRQYGMIVRCRSTIGVDSSQIPLGLLICACLTQLLLLIQKTTSEGSQTITWQLKGLLKG